MAYTVVDLLDKFILIEKNGYELFMKLAKSGNTSSKVKVIARVFAKEEERHIGIYASLKKQMEEQKDIEVDFDVYDKAMKLIYEFLKLNEVYNADNTDGILEFCLDFEKRTLALALSIQGILVKSSEVAETENYKVLSKIINEEKKHVSNIEGFLSK